MLQLNEEINNNLYYFNMQIFLVHLTGLIQMKKLKN
jgi:hypothetical protein